LKHKDVLLRELSHRVMNSLQTVSALFKLQLKSMKAASDAAQFKEAIGRIDAIALAYQRMQAAHGIESVEFASFLKELCNDLRSSVMERSCIVKADPLMLAPEQAIPLSLIVNELLANAIKHGSLGGGQIVVELTNASEQCRLVVRNDGSLPEGYMAESKGFGMKMISSMVSQLCGNLDVSSTDGKTEFVVSFRPAAPGPSIGRSSGSPGQCSYEKA
jgi:two-component sensor histidine kinase